MADEAAPALVAVTQEDRKAAAELYERVSNPSWNSSTDRNTNAGEHILAGLGDGSPWVQSLCSHRLAAERRAQSEGAQGEAAAVLSLAEAAGALNIATDGMEQFRPQREGVLVALKNLACARSTTASPDMVLVPRACSMEMSDAYYDAHAASKSVIASPEEVWSAMIAAATSQISVGDA